MNADSTQQTPPNATTDKASKFLSSLNRFATSSGPTLTRDETPAAEARPEARTETRVEPRPETRREIRPAVDVDDAPDAASIALPTRAPANSRPRSTKRRPAEIERNPDNDRLDRTFEVAAGRGVRVLTARIPRELHARVYLVATNNRFAERDAPQTINELVMDALNEWLDKHDAA